LKYANGTNFYPGHSREGIFEFLLNLGVDATVTDDLDPSHTPLHHLVWSGSSGDFQHPILPSIRKLLPYLTEIVCETSDEVIIHGVLSEFHGTAEEFKFLQREICPNYFDMPQSTRIAVATRVAAGFWDTEHIPELIRAMLGGGPLHASALQVKCDTDFGSDMTLIHCVARKLGIALARMGFRYRLHPSYCAIYKAWSDIFIELFHAGIDVHCLSGGKCARTPLGYFIDGYLDWIEFLELDCVELNTALKIWLRDLLSAGVDLEEFGRVEERAYQAGSAWKDYQSQCWDRDDTNWRLIGFNYGPSPKDWHLWMSEYTDSFLEGFWKMAEREEEVMPGSWPNLSD
jgi:hypothetical protein